MNQQTNNPVEVMKLLNEERTGCNELICNLEKQKGIVNDYNEASLLETIQEKERIIAKLNKIGDKIQQTVKTLSKNEHDQLIKTSQAIRDEIESLLNRVLVLENHCETILKQIKSNLQGKVKSLRKNRVILKGYEPSSFKRSFFSRNV